ncbi:MAG TPA: DNA polymerase III subunit alpha, partial [Thermodesulfobacteriota bacterium]|nr:DNA polymerase III subunit alpha [Thermodesulfobacteriota bacterium]
FYQKALQHGIKPILGCEIYVASGSRFEKKAGEREEGSHHLTLLVKNETGYFNLLKLVSLAHIEGFYYKPRVDKELLNRYHEGLIALSGCMKGEVAVRASKGEMKNALQAAQDYRKIFGAERFYIEIQNTGVENQLLLNQRLIEIGRQLSIPLAATNDCHYLHKKDAKAHEVLLCIQTGKTLQETQRMRFPSEEFYFKSPQEMTDLFRDCPDALSNTLAIAEQCNLEIRFDEKHIPRITVPSGETSDSYLEKLAREGLERRLARYQGEKDFKDREVRYKARLEEELKIIKSMGYPGYFLIVYDFIHHAKSQGIPVGPGRGSAAGSLVAYSLNITDLDPIEYDLIFERFLNPGRKSSMPDVDIDFCMEGREDVIRYVTEKYGKENVAQIITFGKMQAKAVIRDVGRVMGIPYSEVDHIAKLIPKQIDITLEQALHQEGALKEAITKDPRMATLFEIAKSLEGLARHASTHAAGVVIANKPLMDYLPLQRGQNGEVVTQYAMKQVEAIGLVKFDFLGLKTLTVVDQAIQLIEKNRGIKVELSEIPLDDPEVYGLLGAGSNLGIFQLESSGMKDLLIKLKPQRFKDIIALVALYRPGPLDSGMVGEFIKRRHGQESIRYEVPALEEILNDTYGVIVYQEQVMRIASTLAHFSLEDADNLRRAMAKKDAGEMERQKEKFLEGAKKNRIPPKKAEKIFEQMETFGRYGFNKSHSAAYALLAYQTAYLKTHYAIEFMAALLTCEAQNVDKIVKYISECREMKIEILPPHINESFKHFAVKGNQIRFGLAAVKNVGDAAIDALLTERGERGPFRSFFDFCQRVDLRRVNRRVVESLIKSGAFDFSNVRRSQMLTSLEAILNRSQAIQKKKGEAQISMFASNLKEEEPYPEIEEFSEKQLIAFEKETVGFYFSRHPLAHYEEAIKRITQEDSSTLSERPNGSEVKICGLVSGLKEITTKKGDRMAFLTLEDIKGLVEVILFPEAFKASLTWLRSGDPIIVRGTLDLSDEQQVKIKGMEVQPLSDVPSQTPKTLHIRIPFASLTPTRLADLKALLLTHRGGCHVTLHITNGNSGETVIALSDQYGVDPSPVFQTMLKHLLGSSHLSLE